MKSVFKKLFIDRKIRNICMSDPAKNADIIKGIADDLFTRYGRDGIRIPFSIDVINGSTIRVKYGCQMKDRDSSSCFDEGMMPEDYAWLYSGEWSDWQPKCPTLPRSETQHPYLLS